MQTGGEFFAVISITSSSQEEQESIASSLQAKYGGLFASVEVDVNLDSSTKSKVSRSELSISTYQRGGAGDDQSLTADIEAVMTRLKAFPTQVKNNPVPYDVQVASYNTLALPEGPNPIDIQAQKDALEGYARIRLKLLSLQNDIEFLQLHPDYFVNPPDITTLNKWGEFVSDQLNQLKNQASKCTNNPVGGCELFPFKLPDDFRLVPRKSTNAITVKAGALSWFRNLPMNKIDAPNGFMIQTKLITEFSETTTPGFMGIGFGIVSEKSGRILCFFKGVGSGGRILTGGVSALNGTDEGIAITTKNRLEYSEDEIYLRMSKKGNQVIDMSFSRNGEDWNIFAENVDLTTMGFESDDTYKVLLTGYSTCNLAVSGKFFDVNITEI